LRERWRRFAGGFDILPHRERMVKEDLEEKFKNPADPF
jgi:type I restriction enzyme R subunit